MLRQMLVSESLPKPLQLVLGIALENWLRYAVVAGLAWLLAYGLCKNLLG